MSSTTAAATAASVKVAPAPGQEQAKAHPREFACFVQARSKGRQDGMAPRQGGRVRFFGRRRAAAYAGARWRRVPASAPSFPDVPPVPAQAGGSLEPGAEVPREALLSAVKQYGSDGHDVLPGGCYGLRGWG